MLEDLMSTVEILVIPPFLAAVLIDASAPKNKIPKYPFAVAVPTLDPTVLLVAFTGSVNEQLLTNAVKAINIARNLMFLIIVIWFYKSPTHMAFRKPPRFFKW
jgi:hypothetical protein